jgi:hypothetical protein
MGPATKVILLTAAIVLPTACSHLRESDEIDPIVHGSWTGEGRFYDRDLNQEYGKFPVAFEIDPDGSVRGHVGEATLTDGVVKSRPEDFLVEARLNGSVFGDGSLPDEHKDRVVFILEPPDGAAMNGDFHLKTNFAFDISMRAGALTLERGVKSVNSHLEGGASDRTREPADDPADRLDANERS